MKRKKLSNKMKLNKTTIATLCDETMSVQRAGAASDYCTEYSPHCKTVTRQDCDFTLLPCPSIPTCFSGRIDCSGVVCG